MPELPEVETCRRALVPLLVGRSIGAVEVRCERLREPVPSRAMAAMVGATLRSIDRRSKYLLFDFGVEHLLVHLGMSGQLFVGPRGAGWLKHEHWRIGFGELVLRYRDPRRFGLVVHVPTSGLLDHRLLSDLGPEPLAGWSADDLIASGGGVKQAIKPFLMDSRRVVGVGNIYATEACFAAGIHPGRAAGRISGLRMRGLHREVVSVLEAALRAGGTTLKDFVSGDGSPGYFALELKAYGRAGEPCGRCGTAFRSMRQSGRTTTYCTGCQH
jgi:formamidopyrimidine-DNA glycosylase